MNNLIKNTGELANDSKKLKEEEPELAKKFTKTTDVNATIRIEGI